MEYLENSDASDDLAEGWCWAKLSEIVPNPKEDIVDGPFGSDLKASEYIDEGVPIVRLQNVDRNRFIEKNIRYISHKKAKDLNRHNFKPGDVIVTKLGDPLGKACIVPENLGPGIVVADIVRVRLNHSFCSIPYLVYSINSQIVTEQFFQHIRGTTRPRVNLGVIRSLKIPLAPLSEQKRIVAKVEELLGRISSVRERLARVQATLKRFRQSVLSAACSGRLTADWRAQQLGVLSAEDLLSSILAERRKFLKEVSSEGEEIKASVFNELPIGWALTYGAHLFVWSSGKFLPEKKQNKGSYPIYGGNGITGYHSEYLVQHPTLVIGRVGALCGNVYLTSGRAWVTDNAIYATWVPTKLNLGFVEMIFSHANLNANAGGSGQPFVNQTILNDLLIPLPPLAEQNEIVKRIGNLLRLADVIEKTLAAGSSRVEKLPQSILAKAFRGELVPTEADLACREGRSYEPASSLLARIKAERDIPRAPVSKKRKRRL